MASKKKLSVHQKIQILQRATPKAWGGVTMKDILFLAAQELGFCDKDFSWEDAYCEYDLDEILCNMMDLLREYSWTWDDLVNREIKSDAARDIIQRTINGLRGNPNPDKIKVEEYSNEVDDIDDLKPGVHMVKLRNGNKCVILKNGRYKLLAGLERMLSMPFDHKRSLGCSVHESVPRPDDIVEVKKISAPCFHEGYDSDGHEVVWREEYTDRNDTIIGPGAFVKVQTENADGDEIWEKGFIIRGKDEGIPSVLFRDGSTYKLSPGKNKEIHSFII